MVEKDKHAAGGVPEFRWTDFTQYVEPYEAHVSGRQQEHFGVTRYEFDQLLDRVKKLEIHTEINKESFNDYN
jgi:hypothetical protein